MNQYLTASDEVNAQIDEFNHILKSYDEKGMLVGEAPCTKDLIEITDHDFKVVSAVSILAVFLIILFVFKSISLPIILILIIEGAIFVNMGIPYLTGTELPFYLLFHCNWNHYSLVPPVRLCDFDDKPL